MDFFNSILNTINDFMYSYILVFLLVFVGIFLSIKTGFVQLFLFKESIRVIFEKVGVDKKTGEHISPFQAMMISTASRVGIGNIAGISLAVVSGGAGAVFWMWVMAFFGGASAFVESTLAQVYKSKDGEGFKGGPAFYIKKGLKNPFFASVFAVVLTLTYAYGFNGLQSFTMTSAFEIYYNESGAEGFWDSSMPVVIGLFLMVISAILFFSKSHIIGKVSALVVPYMALGYMLLTLIVMVINYNKIPLVLGWIFSNAFDFQAIFGGFAGSCVVIGIKRGLFSNEAGMGSSPNAAAAAHTSHPVKQGLVQMFAVFFDILICSSSAFLVLFSTAYATKQLDSSGALLTALPLVQVAMQEYFGRLGLHFITIAIVLFAVTSLIGNYYYAQANIKFLTGNKWAVLLFKITAVLMVFIGAQLNLTVAWNLADVLMAVMATINIAAIFLLAPVVRKVLNDYLAQRKAGKNPVFKARDAGIENTECWD